MDSIARGLTALSPSIGAAEDFIAKKGIPEEQVPAFLAKLGDPTLAGLIAQKQRLKQVQAKQVPPGGPQQSPPTVKDEINQKLAQILQSRQQSQLQDMQAMQNAQAGQGMPPQGAQPPQPGQPPMPPQGAQPPQGGPPVQAAAGGLMGMGLGGLDAGAMEAPRHFDGGGVVAFTAGGTAPKTKKELEEEEKENTSPYADIYKLGTQYIEDLRGSKAYHQVAGTEDDPAVKLERELMEKQMREGKSAYEREHGYDAEMAGWMRGLSGAFRGETLGQSLTNAYDKTIQERKAADTTYKTLKEKLDTQNLNLVKAMTRANDTNSKADHDQVGIIRDGIYNTLQDMQKIKVDEVKWDADRSDRKVDVGFKEKELELRQKQLDNEKAQIYKPTDQTNAQRDYYNGLKARKAAGDPELKDLSDAELQSLAREKAQYAGVGIKLESAENQNLLDNYRYFQADVDKAQQSLTRALARNGGDKNHPEVQSAQRALDNATSLRDRMKERMEQGADSKSSGVSSRSSSPAASGSSGWSLLSVEK